MVQKKDLHLRCFSLQAHPVPPCDSGSRKISTCPVQAKPRTAFDHSATCSVQAHAGAVVAFLRLIASVVIQYSLIILIIHLQMPTCKSILSTAVSHRNACRTYQDKADALCLAAWQPQSKNKLHYIDYQYDMIRNHTYFLPRIEEGTKRQTQFGLGTSISAPRLSCITSLS